MYIYIYTYTHYIVITGLIYCKPNWRLTMETQHANSRLFTQHSGFWTNAPFPIDDSLQESHHSLGTLLQPQPALRRWLFQVTGSPRSRDQRYGSAARRYHPIPPLISICCWYNGKALDFICFFLFCFFLCFFFSVSGTPNGNMKETNGEIMEHGMDIGFGLISILLKLWRVTLHLGICPSHRVRNGPLLFPGDGLTPHWWSNAREWCTLIASPHAW